MNELENFLKAQLRDGVNYTYSLKKLAKEKNPYAAFELGEMEYRGTMTGTPRYVKAYEYFKIAAEKNHPRANWLISKMLLEGQIGKSTDEDLRKAYQYLKNAEECGSIAATNTIGLCYLNGWIPDKPKNIEMAIKYFKKAADKDYVYAHNNLGKIFEEKGDYEKAYSHYYFSASLEESWALNKIGQWYRTGTFLEKDMKKAYEYYNKALEVPQNILNHWAYFNLAKYFYMNGNYEANIEKNQKKAIEYFEICIKSDIDEAYQELINIYIDKYLENQNDECINKINKYMSKLELKPYYEKCKKNILEKLSILQKEKLIIIKAN